MIEAAGPLARLYRNIDPEIGPKIRRGAFVRKDIHSRAPLEKGIPRPALREDLPDVEGEETDEINDPTDGKILR